jgi:hypothetical protein
MATALAPAIPAACSAPPPPPPAAPAPPAATSPAEDAAPPEAGAEDASGPAAATDAPPEDAGPPPFEDRTVACGSRLCHVDREVCCGGGATATCAPRVVTQTAPSNAELAPQIEACNGSLPMFCDDSSDCGSGELCCQEWFASDSDVTQCKKDRCTFTEPCVPERPCRTPGTACFGHVCRRTDVHVPCDGQVCTGATPLCCTDPEKGARACVAVCRTGSALTCTKAADCGNGRYCQGDEARSWCTGAPDIANAAVLCAADADCPRNLCIFSHGGRPRCEKGTGVRRCACL